MCTTSDPQGRPTVFDRLPHISKSRWLYIGRLDVNTSGLLLFTTDGELANSLMHPSHEIERVYAVRVFGEVTKEHLQALQTNVELEDGPAHFDKVIYVGGEGMNQWYNVVLKEGRKREVRRLWEALGLKVSRLKRIKYGCVELGRLPVGGYEELSLQEVNDLRALAGLKPERKTMVNEEVKSETTSRDEYLKNRQIKKTFKKFATKNDYDRRSRDARRAKSGQGDKGFVSMYAQDIDYSNFSSIYAGINTNGDNRIHRTHGPHQSQDNRRGSRSQAWGKDNSFDRKMVIFHLDVQSLRVKEEMLHLERAAQMTVEAHHALNAQKMVQNHGVQIFQEMKILLKEMITALIRVNAHVILLVEVIVSVKVLTILKALKVETKMVSQKAQDHVSQALKVLKEKVSLMMTVTFSQNQHQS